MASSNQAKIELTADEQGVLKALAAVERGFGKITDRLEGVERATRSTKRSQDAMLQSALKGVQQFGQQLLGVGSAMSGIMAVANQIKREYENLKSRQQGAANEQIGFEGALSQAVRNATGIFSAEQVRNLSLQMAQNTGVTPARAASTIGSALTSTGVTNKAEAELAIQAATAGLQFAPELESSGVEAISGVSASLAKRFGVRPSAAIGFIQRVGGQANIRDLEPLINNLAPVVANLTQFGFSPQEAGALAATITQGTGDVTGELSGTAAVNLADSLSKAFPGVAPGEAIRRLQGDEAARTAFLEGGRIDGRKVGPAVLGKGKAKPTIRGILTADTVESRQFAGSQEAIGGFAQGQETFDTLIGEIASVTPVSRLQRTFSSAVSRTQVLDKSGGTTAVSRQGLQDLLKAAGASDAAQRVAALAFETESGITEQQPIETVVEALQSRAAGLRRGRIVGGGGGPGAMGGVQAGERAPASAAAVQQAERLLEIVTVLKSMQDDQRRRDPPAQRRRPAAEALGRRD